ncbi:MAG: hypothetical protein ABSD38_12255 [Syntrophorhabdales bacterium]|jgi:hypothetical protein
MKRQVSILATLFCLLIVSCPYSGYAAGPDGFANVPWGASKSQVDQAMAQQGFSSEGEVTHHYVINDGSIVFSYYGTLASAVGHVQLFFLNGAFYDGYFNFHDEDGVGTREVRAYQQFLAVIQSKYGPPGQSGPNYSIWRGLQAPASSDTIAIRLSYSVQSSRCGGGFCSSSFSVSYSNESLKQRLLAAGVNGKGL